MIYGRLYEKKAMRNSGTNKKTNRFGTIPEGCRELGPDVWGPRGVKVLGIPVGSAAFVGEHIAKRLEEEVRL